MNFSIVAPIKNEIKLIPRTLPSYYRVGAREVVLCFDDPPDDKTLAVTRKVVKACNAEDITKFIFVKRDPEWAYHQANVRRSGFREAKYDKILTADIDLILNKNLLKAINLVGKNDVGLCSCSKFYYPSGLIGFWRAGGYDVFRRLYTYMRQIQTGGLSFTTFTGLYAIYRPYWLDSEDPEEVKKLTTLKTKKITLTQSETIRPVGEDTFLRDSMLKKHKVIYLPDIGAICLAHYMHDRPKMQFENGRYCFDHDRSLLGAIIHAYAYAHPHFMRGFLYEKIRSNKKMRIMFRAQPPITEQEEEIDRGGEVR